MDNLTKQTRTGARNNLAETLAKWAEINNDPKTKTRKAPAKGSTKGCMKGKGGPENNRCSFRGVRQRTWGKWVAEIRQPNEPQKLWLGTFDSAVEAAVAYDKAARTIYGSYAILNFPDYSPNDQSLLCKTASTCGSTFNCSQSESSQVRESKTAQNVCEARASEVDANVTGISNDDDMIDIDELLGGMDKKVESINEASSSQPMYDAWFENKADDYDFDFGFLETGSEECNFTLDELCR